MHDTISLTDLRARRDKLTQLIGMIETEFPQLVGANGNVLVPPVEAGQRAPRRGKGGAGTVNAPNLKEAVIGALKEAASPVESKDLSAILVQAGVAKSARGLGALYARMAGNKEIKKTAHGYVPAQ